VPLYHRLPPAVDVRPGFLQLWPNAPWVSLRPRSQMKNPVLLSAVEESAAEEPSVYSRQLYTQLLLNPKNKWHVSAMAGECFPVRSREASPPGRNAPADRAVK